MKKYNIIYADPPWDYGNTKNLNGDFWGMADKHYDVMKFKDICNLPVGNIAANDCYLFLWVTSPFLEKGFEVIKSWGVQICNSRICMGKNVKRYVFYKRRWAW